MYNYNDDEEDFAMKHNYSPNELANLSITNNAKYKEIVSSNLEDKSVEQWENENLKKMQNYLKK